MGGANAGNVSVDVTGDYDPEGAGSWKQIETSVHYPELAGCSFLSGYGRPLQGRHKRPEDHVVLARIADDLTGYEILAASGKGRGHSHDVGVPGTPWPHAYLRRAQPLKKTVLTPTPTACWRSPTLAGSRPPRRSAGCSGRCTPR